jgi:ADP-L-glycero-D-manno-heptose 6-epimerase
MTRILVTGSEGFIGQNMCEYLSARDFDVVGYDVKNIPFGGESAYYVPDLRGFSAVIHLGANSSTTEKNLPKILKQNFIFSQELYNKCKLTNTKFQYASSASVYGNHENVVFKEDQFCYPINAYALSKYMFDVWLQTQTFPYQGFRYFNVYGKCEDHKEGQASPIHTFTKQAKENGVIKLFYCSDRFYRDFVHVDDVCEAHYRMLYCGHTGVYNVGTGHNVSFERVAELIADKYNAKIERIPMPPSIQKGYQQYTKADNSKLTKVIGNLEWTKVVDYIKYNV